MTSDDNRISYIEEILFMFWFDIKNIKIGLGLNVLI